MLHHTKLPLSDGDRSTLRTEILRRAATEKGHRSHNVGGWRSHSDLLDWPTASWLRGRLIQLLIDLQLAIRPETLRAWAVVSRKGAYHGRHVHVGRYDWTGILYLDPGGQPSARTVFEVGMGKEKEIVYVEPEVDRVVVFPANLWHSVEEHRGDGERLAIAFDVTAAGHNW